MSQIILTFQIDEKTKQLAKKKSARLGISLSEYLRDLVEQDLGLDKNNNPWLELAASVQSIMSKEEIEQMFDEVQKDRRSRSEESWERIANLAADINI